MSYYDVNQIQPREIFPGLHSRLIHTDKMTLSFLTIDDGAIIPEHSHHHEQIVIMGKGKLELTLDGNTHLLEAGSVLVIPSNTPHSGKALTDVVVQDVFTPPREDYQ